MFKSKSLPGKKVIVEKERLCWNCLAKGHQIKECKSNTKCRKMNCGKHHPPSYTFTQNQATKSTER